MDTILGVCAIGHCGVVCSIELIVLDNERNGHEEVPVIIIYVLCSCWFIGLGFGLAQ